MGTPRREPAGVGGTGSGEGGVSPTHETARYFQDPHGYLASWDGDTPGAAYYHERRRLVLGFLRGRRAGRLLDAGCGPAVMTDVLLARGFDYDGIDLSGGEWQKVALARAYMRDAQLLILDEPTAALDARAEYDVFVRFNALMSGRMAIVISHRFSTVRMADRIIVLKNGEVVEHGTHDDLAQRTGLYSELFHMQAAGYR